MSRNFRSSLSKLAFMGSNGHFWDAALEIPLVRNRLSKTKSGLGRVEQSHPTALDLNHFRPSLGGIAIAPIRSAGPLKCWCQMSIAWIQLPQKSTGIKGESFSTHSKRLKASKWIKVPLQKSFYVLILWNQISNRNTPTKRTAAMHFLQFTIKVKTVQILCRLDFLPAEGWVIGWFRSKKK